MSFIETLLEAAKYVDKDETTESDDTSSKSQEITTTHTMNYTKASQPSNVAIKHWRKRVVAQSVLESQTRDLKERNHVSASCDKTADVMSMHRNPVFNSVSSVSHGQLVGNSGTTVEEGFSIPVSNAQAATDQALSMDNTQPTKCNEPHAPFSTSFHPFAYDSASGVNTTFSGNEIEQIRRNVSESQNKSSLPPVLPQSYSQYSKIAYNIPLSESRTFSNPELNASSSMPVSNEYNPLTSDSNEQRSNSTDFQPHLETDEFGNTLSNNLSDQFSGEYGKTGQLNSQYQNASKFDKQKNVVSMTVTREAHNLIEKNRRAHLKECFDNLRNMVPSLGTRKVSNLIILREALKYVQSLKRKEQKQQHDVEALVREKINKKEKLSALRRKLALHLDTEAIEEILKVKENNEEAIKQLTSPVKPCQTDYNTSTASEKEDSTDESPPAKESKKLPGNSSITSAEDDRSSSDKSIDQDAMKYSSMEPVAQPSELIMQKPDNREFPQFGSLKQPSILNPNPAVLSPSFFIPRTSSVPPVWPNVQVYKSDENSNNIRSISNQVKKSNPMPATTWKLTQISANYVDSTAWPAASTSTISATVHRVQSVKPYKRVITSELASFLDTGNGVNPLKIVVKPVESAKQHALASKAAVKNMRSAELSKSAPKPTSSRPRQSELVFRPRSSMTPPPPSRITPYFPRFSVGSGGSPPLTTIMPNMNDISQKGAEEMEQEKQQDALMSNNQITMWRTPTDYNTEANFKSSKKFHKVALKRKSTSEMESLVGKVMKSNFPSSVENSSSYRVSSSGMTVTPAVNSDTESETETSENALSTERSAVTENTSVRPSIPVILSPAILPQAIHQNKSVTQVCYSTLSKATKPTIPSSFAVIKTPEVEQLSVAQNSWPKAEYLMPQMLNKNPQIGINNTRHHPQQVTYQIVQPTFMNRAVLQSPVAGSYINFAQNSPETGNHPKPKSDEEGSKRETENHVNQTPVNGEENAPNRISVVQQNQAQMPQIQYVIPMGFPGMMAGAGAQMGFSPAMGGFMPITPMPQGQGWSYIVPQNMVISPNGKNITTVDHKQSESKDDESNKVHENTAAQGNTLPVIINEMKEKTIHTSAEHTQLKTSTCVNGTATASSVGNMGIPDSNSHGSSIPRTTDVTVVQQQNVPITLNNQFQNPWQQQNMQRTFQPQFQIVRPNFQTANQIMIPMGAAGSNGGYIIGGAPTAMPGAQGVASIPRSASNIGYSFPMNIVGYPMQIGAPPVQIAAMPNGTFNIPRGLTYGIAGGMPAQIVTQQNSQGSAGETANVNISNG